MEVTGKINKINEDLGYGFIKCPKLDDVFFSEKSTLLGVTFTQLKVNDSVRVLVKETERGLFAESLSLDHSKRRERSPEVNL